MLANRGFTEQNKKHDWANNSVYFSLYVLTTIRTMSNCMTFKCDLES